MNQSANLILFQCVPQMLRRSVTIMRNCPSASPSLPGTRLNSKLCASKLVRPSSANPTHSIHLIYTCFYPPDELLSQIQESSQRLADVSRLTSELQDKL